MKGGNRPLSACLPGLTPYARLPWPKAAVFTWKSPDFSYLLPACLTLAAAACTSLACLPDLILEYRQAGRKKIERCFVLCRPRTLYRSRKTLRGNSPYYSWNTLRGRPEILNLLAMDRRRLPLPPRQLPLLRGQTQRQRRMSRLRHERRLVYDDSDDGEC